ncbi:MAG: hypothetical protein EYC62_04150 [Alphaproteobacteria bacterium]|nr:MAG: hypothetical protein EYC62_04150 [Alphaproteobacteria bacterium]
MTRLLIKTLLSTAAISLGMGFFTNRVLEMTKTLFYSAAIYYIAHMGRNKRDALEIVSVPVNNYPNPSEPPVTIRRATDLQAGFRVPAPFKPTSIFEVDGSEPTPSECIPEDDYTPPTSFHFISTSATTQQPPTGNEAAPYQFWSTPGPCRVQPSIIDLEAAKKPLPAKLAERINNADWSQLAPVATQPATGNEATFQTELPNYTPKPIQDRGALMDEQTRRNLNREYVR